MWELAILFMYVLIAVLFGVGNSARYFDEADPWPRNTFSARSKEEQRRLLRLIWLSPVWPLLLVKFLKVYWVKAWGPIYDDKDKPARIPKPTKSKPRVWDTYPTTDKKYSQGGFLP